MKKKFFLLAVLFSFTFTIYGQFSLDMEYRPRTEYRHGYSSLIVDGEDAAFFTAHRGRLKAKYATEKIKFYTSIQDIRVWGNTRQLNSSDGQLSTHQLWVDLMLSPKISLKLGRQEIIYDDSRMFGNVGWAHQSRSHDAALLKYGNGKTKVHLGLAYNQQSQRTSSTNYELTGNYKTFQYLWLNHPFTENLSASFLALNNGFQSDITVANPDEGTNFSQTIGTFLKYGKDKISATASAYYQMGKGRNPDVDIAALQWSADLAYKVGEKTSIGIGYEYLSGTDINDEENKSFTPFFGTNHKFNGHMDQFYVGNHGNSIGLQDLRATLKTKVNGWSLRLDGHQFSSAVSDSDLSGSLGTEFDFSVGKMTSIKGVKFTAGYSHFLPTDEMKALRVAAELNGSQNWAWTMVSVNLNVLKTKPSTGE